MITEKKTYNMATDCLDIQIYEPHTEVNDYLRKDELHQIAHYLLTRKFDDTTYKWFREYDTELHQLYEQIDEWCQKVGWNLTKKMDFYVFCKMIAKMNVITDNNEVKKRTYAYHGSKIHRKFHQKTNSIHK